jgi:pimeloyl-ACP methyl ester carboxylesterase
LTLGVSAHRISTDQQAYLNHWVELARQNAWETIYLELARLMHSGLTKDNENDVLAFLAPAMKRVPDCPDTFIHSVQASMSHDTSSALHNLRMPVLLIGGTRDRLFPEHIMRQAARLVQNALLHLIPDTGHGAFDEQKRQFDTAVKQFIWSKI